MTLPVLCLCYNTSDFVLLAMVLIERILSGMETAGAAECKIKKQGHGGL